MSHRSGIVKSAGLTDIAPLPELNRPNHKGHIKAEPPQRFVSTVKALLIF